MNKINNSQGLQIPEKYLVTPAYVFFLVNSMQVGVGILGFEKYLVEKAGFDAWVSILIAGGILHVVLWMIYRLLQKGGGDIVHIHKLVFGKYIGGFLSLLFCAYFTLLAFTVLITFIEVIKVWVFPGLQSWIFGFVLLLLVYYLVSGGFRVITGVCLISVLIGLPILLLKFFPVQAGHTMTIYPVLSHDITEILSASKQSVLSFLGLEFLLIYYPFIKNPKKSKKWAHFAVFYTTMIYLISLLVTFVYYSEEQLKQVVWGTISAWKIVEFPFIERFEFVGIAMWLYVVLPNICLGLWGATRIPKRVFNIKQKYLVIIFCIGFYIPLGFIEGRPVIDAINTFSGQAGFYIILYIPVLLALKIISDKVRKRHEK
ncbi:spore germination protein (amino acid permease) [Halobacillus karajensis]|uniref:Spore germination protein B2 n=1 Tax=Halobacillus karajensis TaxID=195088 RepID=A0A059NXL5_9BACI|nr:GerAB/ArcD/ProY family transporter [Halobacillus karajensis]CDQ18403.1 Spore germination protein B2 [Halobacillus karajensis]CDQ23525.1 Spore germination protein B2 [Halobacillus karajensis]CDQ27007.1 Spore germination protein B2 [Halobacillus karajensis]SEH51871.1 spore germination protein (amino acid permease) [Halobacillus karajensis]